jgi:hypothetical protein
MKCIFSRTPQAQFGLNTIFDLSKSLFKKEAEQIHRKWGPRLSPKELPLRVADRGLQESRSLMVSRQDQTFVKLN